MKNKYLFFAVVLGLLLGAVAAEAQATQDLGANIVKIAGSRGSDEDQPRYGFITGTGTPAKPEFYFIVLSKDRQFLESRPKLNVVVYNPSKKTTQPATAELLTRQEPPSIGSYYVALYRVAGGGYSHQHFYQPIDPAALDGYHLFWDTEEDDNSLKPHYGGKDRDEINQVEGQSRQHLQKLPVRFQVAELTRGALAHAGMPLLNKAGSVAGVIAENQKSTLRSFDVLNIFTIKNKLNALGQARANDACAYFNLIEQGRTKTVCDSLRLVEEFNRKSLAERQAYIAGLNRAQKRMLQRDKNYPFAVSISASGYSSVVSMTYAQGKDGAAGLNYSLGANLHFSPDSAIGRFTFKPRYAQYSFQPPAAYQFASSVGFVLKDFRVRTIEVPIMMEFVSRRKTGDTYFGLGYAPGMQQMADFSFTTTANQTVRREALHDNPRFTHKLVLELGYDVGKARFAVSYAHQFQQFLRRDYTFIIGGESLTPLRDTGPGYGSLGLEVAYRLWGRWQNGRIAR